ncbi:hypothetical protein EST38_g9631 [Candolleomyces aberdarensis]|uniref:Uncharacterized protein n=1 Tax=Candolleomyces aberdarensis TaxID=2316362 RepID=A0A4Q2D9H9_9AGAR|nr:hypothetical protein EST38_g9631 [Candolleomyces aberdarensis]
MGGIMFKYQGKLHYLNLADLLEENASENAPGNASESTPEKALDKTPERIVENTPAKYDKDMLAQARAALENPPITSEEISDRSKADAFAKGAVIIQTSWFIIQFVCRAGYGLGITELEVMTLAYAVLNAAMYAFWWNKPLDVQCPVIISLSSKDGMNEDQKDQTSSKSDSEQERPVINWSPFLMYDLRVEYEQDLKEQFIRLRAGMAESDEAGSDKTDDSKGVTCGLCIYFITVVRT